MDRQSTSSRRAFLAAAGTSALLAGTGVGQLAAEPDNEALRAPLESREFHRDVGTSLDDFSDLSAWTATAGTLQAETTDPYVGDQSGLLVGDADDSRVRIVRQFDGLDLASADLSAAIRLDEPAHGEVTVRALAPDWSNRIDMSRPIGLNMDSWFRADLGVTGEFGSPDLSDVRQLVVDINSGGGTARLAVDDLRLTPKADRGYVLVTFDDGLTSQHSRAYPIMEEYGIPGFAAVNPDSVGGAGRMTVDQLRELQDAGWEVGNHTVGHDHLPDLPADERRARIRDGKQWLLDRGFDPGAESIVYPFGDADGPTLTDAGDYHQMGFIAGSNLHGTRLTDPLTIGRINGDRPNDARSAVDLAARHNQLVVLMYHAVTEADDGSISPAEFDATMAHIDAKGDDVAVLTPSQYRTEVLGGEPTPTTTAEPTTTTDEPSTTTSGPTTTESTTTTTAEPTTTTTSPEPTTTTADPTTTATSPTPTTEPPGSGGSGPPGGSGGGPSVGTESPTPTPTATPTPSATPTATGTPTSTTAESEPMTVLQTTRETEMESVPTTAAASPTRTTAADSGDASLPPGIGLIAALGGAGATVAYLLSGDRSDR